MPGLRRQRRAQGETRQNTFVHTMPEVGPVGRSFLLLPANGFTPPHRLVLFRSRGALVGFDMNFNLSALFQLHFVAVLVGQGVFDPNFLIERLGPMNIYLRLLGFARVHRLD
jgi:hypothetical protein